MKTEKTIYLGIVLVVIFFSASGMAEDHAVSGKPCVGYGPQTPRDIDNKGGENKCSLLLLILGP